MDTMDFSKLVPTAEQIAENERRRAEADASEAKWFERQWRQAYAVAAPVRVAEAAWDARDTPAVTAVRAWLDGGQKTHIVLRGGVGCGKTTAACVAAKAWSRPANVGGVSPSDNVVWLRPDALVSAVLHDYDRAAPRLRPKVVIDDMGRETKADFTEALCEVLDRSGHTLLITTNLTKAQMRERYDARLLDRLRDTAIAVDLPGKSLRKASEDF